MLWHAVDYVNLNGVGSSFPTVIWHGMMEYSLLATWLLAVSTHRTRSPFVRVMRGFGFLPALCISVFAACIIIKHLLPGGEFYLATVLAHDGLGEFLVYHVLYAITFVPLVACALVVLRDGYVALKLFRGRTPSETHSA